MTIELPHDKNFSQWKVLIFGLGINGGGVDSALWFARHGAKVTITDTKDATTLAPSLRILEKSPHAFRYALDGHKESDILSSDLIIQNPGVPHSSPYLILARKKNIPIHSATSIFFTYWKGDSIGVTGTRGKSTTAQLVWLMLRRAYPKAYIGGMPNTPLLKNLDKGTTRDIAVLELSSWNTEFLSVIKKSPRCAVITNIYEDHLNRYDGLDDYLEAKWNIAQWQTHDDILILNHDIPALVKKARTTPPPSNIYWVSCKERPDRGMYYKGKALVFSNGDKEEQIMTLTDAKGSYIAQGEHNHYNLAVAALLAKLKNVPRSSIKSVAKNFSGLPGRQELVATIHGAHYYNDTTSTTPIACQQALLTLGAQKKVILIAGGVDKNLPYASLAKLIVTHARAVILLPGSATEKLTRALKKERYPHDLIMVDSLAQAVETARALTRPHDRVLFSPAAASFNLFLNEFDRGAQFNELVARVA